MEARPYIATVKRIKGPFGRIPKRLARALPVQATGTVSILFDDTAYVRYDSSRPVELNICTVINGPFIISLIPSNNSSKKFSKHAPVHCFFLEAGPPIGTFRILESWSFGPIKFLFARCYFLLWDSNQYVLGHDRKSIRVRPCFGWEAERSYWIEPGRERRDTLF
jgi:hypothetical protein